MYHHCTKLGAVSTDKMFGGKNLCRLTLARDGKDQKE